LKALVLRPANALRLPEPVENALCDIFGSGVRRVRLVPNSFYVRLHGRADATTRRNVIYLRGSLAEFAADPELMLHEYFHVIHQWHSRRLTIRRYLLEWLRHGYWNNRFEREARDFTSAQRMRLVVMLQQGERPEPQALSSERHINGTSPSGERRSQFSRRSA
jgi:hypothetical protein